MPEYLSNDPWAGVLGAAEDEVGLRPGLLSAIATQEGVDPRHNNPLGLSNDAGVHTFAPHEAVARIHRQAALLKNPNGPYHEFARTGDINALAAVYSPVGAANDIHGTNGTEASGIKAALDKRYVSTDPNAAEIAPTDDIGQRIAEGQKYIEDAQAKYPNSESGPVTQADAPNPRQEEVRPAGWLDKLQFLRSKAADELGHIASLGLDKNPKPPTFTPEQIRAAAAALPGADKPTGAEAGITDSLAHQLSGFTSPDTIPQLAASPVTIPAFVGQRLLSLPEQYGRIKDATQAGGKTLGRAVADEAIPDAMAFLAGHGGIKALHGSAKVPETAAAKVPESPEVAADAAKTAEIAAPSVPKPTTSENTLAAVKWRNDLIRQQRELSQAAKLEQQIAGRATGYTQRALDDVQAQLAKGYQPPELPAAETVRLYHGANRAAGQAGSDFTPDLKYAQGYANKSGENGMVWYVDIPRGSLKTHDEYGLPLSKVVVPNEIADQAKPLPVGPEGATVGTTPDAQAGQIANSPEATAPGDTASRQQPTSDARAAGMGQPEPGGAGAGERQNIGVAERYVETEAPGTVIPGERQDATYWRSKGRQFIDEGGDPRMPVRSAAAGHVSPRNVGIVSAEFERLSLIKRQAADALEERPQDPALQQGFRQASDAWQSWRREMQPVLTRAGESLAAVQGELPVDLTTFDGLHTKAMELNGGRELTPAQRAGLMKRAKASRPARAAEVQAVDRLGQEIDRAFPRREVPTEQEMSAKVEEMVKRMTPCP